MSVAAASSTATLTADEIVVGTALGGQKYLLKQFSNTINLATNGAGGMDTSTTPVSGYVALYAIYNPTTAASALLATNSTSTVAPNVYGGGNAPAGYTASALVSVWATNGSGQFVAGLQADRSISIIPNVVLNSNTSQASLTALSISGAVPKNAVSVTFRSSLSSSSAGWSGNITITPSAGGIATQTVGGSNGAANSALYGTLPDVGIAGNSQQVFYICGASPGTPTYGVNVLGYKF
ncbi:tail protein [Burkholderia contaminans FFH2055]|nr:tail protein [Burkholderia contaminans FFH2055]